jgi:hypothetical protein
MIPRRRTQIFTQEKDKIDIEFILYVKLRLVGNKIISFVVYVVRCCYLDITEQVNSAAGSMCPYACLLRDSGAEVRRRYINKKPEY